LAYILKELAGADELRALKLAPSSNSNKANAVNKYQSILRGANDSCDGESSYTDSTNYNGSDSSQEKSLSVKHHCDKKQSGKSSKRSSNLSSSNSSSEEERKPKKKAVEVVTT
jgi:hypothetical protein